VRVLHADLHIHTCLSPCAETGMSPFTVARLARQRGLDVIAICDHNSAENVTAVRTAARPIGLAVIGGMEITSQEEVHVLGLFPEDGSLAAAQAVVYEHLAGENDPDMFGEQLVMNEQDEVIKSNHKLLIGATDLTLEDVVQTIHELGGLAIASHVDRPSFSVISQLGFIPQSLGLDAVESCSDRVSASPEGLPMISSSDAHRPGQIGTRCTRFLIDDPTIAEIGMALKHVGGRRIVMEQ